ncbi:MAG: membrane protein insertion efficiency factor YidD [bacterium]
MVAVVLIYQRYAPARIRNSCRFEPTCSNYAMLAIRKYGAFIGVMRSFRRIISCHEPNGGVDNP